jgi:hypothetical protein
MVPLQGASYVWERGKENTPDGGELHVGVSVQGEPAAALQNVYETAGTPVDAALTLGVLGCGVAVVYGLRYAAGTLLDRAKGVISPGS